MKTISLLLFSLCAFADGPGKLVSKYSKQDFALTADPNAKQWKGVPAAVAMNGPRGEPVPGHRTRILSRWTTKNLYFLFVCPYEELHLKPNPSTTQETNKLWDYDVAEVFVGSNFQNIRQYKEFEVSPQGEWVDLDIDRDHPKPDGGWLWNSGFHVKARVDEAKKIWYGEMQIPIASIDTRVPKPGTQLRVNLYRIQGSPPHRRYIAWQPTGAASYHVPESFGLLVLGR